MEVVWARDPGTRLFRGGLEVNWLEHVWLGKRENSDEHLCVDEHGVRNFRTFGRQPETARFRRTDASPFNPKPKGTTSLTSPTASQRTT